MARESRPQPGDSAVYPNAGPYSANQWGELFRDFIVGEDYPDKGVFYATANQLEVTNPAATNIQIDTGRAHVFGRYLRNTAAVTITPTAPVANPRIDRVVAVLNNTNGAIATQAASGYTFNVAGGGTTIPAYTVEIAIMKGAEAGAPTVPALEQDSTRLWMIPLAQYNISVVPAVSSLTDQRDWVDLETKYMLFQAVVGYNLATTTNISLGTTVNYLAPSVPLPDTQRAWAQSRTTIPDDFVSDLTVDSIAAGGNAGGNVYVKTYFESGDCGDEQSLVSEDTGYLTEAIGASRTGVYCYAQLNVTGANVTPGEIVRLTFERQATNDPPDTATEALHFVGFRLTYTGYKR